MRINYAFFIALVFITACDSDFFSPIIELELPDVKPKLVVLGHLEEGTDTLQIVVSSTRSLLDTTPFSFLRSDTFWFPDSSRFHVNNLSGWDIVEQVHIELYKNNTLIATFQNHKKWSGVYTAVLNQPLTYEPNTLYTLKASAPGFESVEAVSSLPRPVPIDTVIVRLDIKVADPTDPSSLNDVNEYGLGFTDPANEKDYYTSSAYYFDSTRLNEREPTYIYSYDFKSNQGQLSDGTFNGKDIIWNVHENSHRMSSRKYLNLSLHHVSESYYLYQLSNQRYSDAHDNPFAEPVILYTNIKNGYGVFSMGSTRSYTIKVK